MTSVLFRRRMTVSAWIVFGSIASLNVTASGVVVSTPTAFGFGILLLMVGGVLSVAALAAPTPITDVAINDRVMNLTRNMATTLGAPAPQSLLREVRQPDVSFFDSTGADRCGAHL